jgi:hypothetical protein
MAGDGWRGRGWDSAEVPRALEVQRFVTAREPEVRPFFPCSSFETRCQDKKCLQRRPMAWPLSLDSVRCITEMSRLSFCPI